MNASSVVRRLNFERFEPREMLAGDIVQFQATANDGFSVANVDSTRTAGLEPYDFMPVGDELYFTANDGIHGWELWKSDGTADGTRLVHDIAPGEPGSAIRNWQEVWSGSSPGEFATVLGDAIISVADDGVRGTSVWRTDIATGDTEFLRFIDTYAGIQFVLRPPSHFVTVGDLVYFTGGRSLWKTDGTAAGTTIVAQPIGWPSQLVEFNDALYLEADHGLSRLKENGRGTEVVNDNQGRSISRINQLRVVADRLFASTDNGLWVSDGTTSGTVKLDDGEQNERTSVVDVDGIQYFNRNRYELWQTDGTPAGTLLVRQFQWPDEPKPLGAANGRLLFSGVDGGIWTTDGIDIELIKAIAPYQIVEAQSLGDELILVFDDGVHGRELWISDGSADGTRLVRDIYPGTDSGIASSAELTRLGDKVYFRASDGTSGVELWATDGTTAGTEMVKDYARSESSEPQHLAAMANGTVLFTADDGHSPEPQLWKTVAGETSLVAILPQPIPGSVEFDGSPSVPTNVRLQEFVPHENKVFFLQRYNYSWGSGNYQHAFDLWESDGTTAGTKLVEREPFSWFYMDGMFEDPKIIVNESGRPELVITQLDPSVGPIAPKNEQRETQIGAVSYSAQELRVGDATIKGIFATEVGGLPTLMKSLPTLEHTGHLSNVGGRLLFVSGENTPNELWTSDGTASGTAILKTFGKPIAMHSLVRDGVLYFSVAETATERILWRSDGTETGTYPLSSQLRNPDEFVSFDDAVYFTALDEVIGRELWKTDGTLEGTQLVADLLPGIGSSAPRELTVAGDSLFFSADHQQFGRELWRLELTSDVLIEDIDRSGKVDFADFLVLAANFGKQTSEGPAGGDLNGDGLVGFADFLRLSIKFGSSAASD